MLSSANDGLLEWAASAYYLKDRGNARDYFPGTRTSSTRCGSRTCSLEWKKVGTPSSPRSWASVNSFESDQRFNAWTPKFGIDYDLTDDIMISWRLGTGPTRTQEVLCSSRRQASDPVDCFSPTLPSARTRDRQREQRGARRDRGVAAGALRAAGLGAAPGSGGCGGRARARCGARAVRRADSAPHRFALAR